jgi:carbamoyltransferase
MAQSSPGRGRRGDLILGVNSVFHESSACLLDRSRLLAFVEEERLTRVKKAKRAAVSNAHVLPDRAIAYCLEVAGADWDDVGYIGYSYDPHRRVLVKGDDVVAGDWGSPEGEAAFQASLGRVPGALSELAGTDVRSRLRWVPHHDAHAASAYFASPYDDAAVLSVDGIGEVATMLGGHGRGTTLRATQEIRYPNSLGFLWEAVSLFLGLDQYAGPAKVMGLAAFGDPDRFAGELGKLLIPEPTGFRVENYYTRFRATSDRLEELFGPRRAPGVELDSRDADLAAALQAATERVLLDTVARLRRETGSSALCLAGGVALNCVATGRIVRESGYEQVFVQPAAGDAGTSLGAALHILHGELGHPDRFVMQHAYLGPSYSEAAMVEALDAARLPYRRCDDIVDHTAQLLADDQLVGWFQGPAEIGPRALGNRSILADPRSAVVKERINLHGKHREYWRPFSPSILAEEAADWVEVGAASPSHAFMSFTYPVRPDKRRLIPAVVHADHHTRGQLVTAEHNPRYHALIRGFYQRTGVPTVLNTSFNGPGEPIVSNPADAVATFVNSGLDALVLGDLLVLRNGKQQEEES